MFHPGSDGPATGFDSDDFEYVELKNAGTNAQNLIGLHVEGAIQFRFTATNTVTSLDPGARLVLVKNLTAFGGRYPGITNIAGEYSGQLGNDGERLALFGPLEEPVFDFRYSDSWQTNADGHGYSLVLANESITSTNFGNAASWTTSARIGGSPGEPEPAILNATLSGGSLNIQFVGAPGVLYHLQRRVDLSAGSWITLESRQASSMGAVQFQISQTEAAGFYRVSGQ
jgi:hypothetical protein